VRRVAKRASAVEEGGQEASEPGSPAAEGRGLLGKETVADWMAGLVMAGPVLPSRFYRPAVASCGVDEVERV
jgi:hypothetical protein